MRGIVSDVVATICRFEACFDSSDESPSLDCCWVGCQLFDLLGKFVYAVHRIHWS